MPKLDGREHWSLVGDHSEQELRLDEISSQLSSKIYSNKDFPVPIIFRPPTPVQNPVMEDLKQKKRRR